MKDVLRQLTGGMASHLGRQLAREYLQARVLECLQRSGAMIPLAFHGGTALRFLYNLPRFSEDLDFALERDAVRYDFRGWLNDIRSAFAAESYRVEVKVNDTRTVHGAFVKFPGLWFELGLSPHESEVVSIKIEVDTNPPAGAGLATTLIRKHVTLNIQHHDPASLLAGKLHAVLQRPHTKGRDLYDLFWYLGDASWPGPNLNLLNNALLQTGWDGTRLDERTWPQALLDRLATVNWMRAVEDVRPFLESPRELSLLTLDNLKQLVNQRFPAIDHPAG